MQISEIKITGMRNLPPGETVIKPDKLSIFTGQDDAGAEIMVRALRLLICDMEISADDFAVMENDSAEKSLRITAKLTFPEVTAPTAVNTPLPALFHLLQADNSGNLFCILEICARSDGSSIRFRRYWQLADGSQQNAELDEILHLQILPSPGEPLHGNTVYFWKNPVPCDVNIALDTLTPYVDNTAALPSQLLLFINDNKLLREIPLKNIQIYSGKEYGFHAVSCELFQDEYICRTILSCPEFFSANAVILYEDDKVAQELSALLSSMGIKTGTEVIFLPAVLDNIGYFWKFCDQSGKIHLTVMDLHHRQPGGDFECIAESLRQMQYAGYQLPRDTEQQMILPEKLAEFAPDLPREKLWLDWLGNNMNLFFTLPESLVPQFFNEKQLPVIHRIISEKLIHLPVSSDQ